MSATKPIWLASAFLILAFWSALSYAGPAEDNVIGAFEGYCLDNLNAPDRATILDLGGNAEPLARPIVRAPAHVRKQGAVGSLLRASFAVQEFGDLDAEITVTNELIERVNAA